MAFRIPVSAFDIPARATVITAAFLMATAAMAGPAGAVRDAAGAPVIGATVEWLGADAWVRTDSEGRFAFSDPDARTKAAPGPEPAPDWRLEGMSLTLGLSGGVLLEVDRVDLRGRIVAGARPVPLGAGRHVLDIRDLVGGASEAGTGWLRIRAGRDIRWVRLASVGGGWGNAWMTLDPRGGPAGGGLARAGGADSLRVSGDGFLRRSAPLAALGTGADITLERGLDFAAHFPGSGLIEDIASGQTLRLPPERRIQVVLVAEGYTREDLDAGQFGRDAEAWMRDIFALEPLGAFKEAFTVWTFAAPSPSRLPRPGMPDPGTSPFRLQVAAGAVQEPGEATRAGIWEVVGRLPHAPWGWYPAGGLTNRQARNVIVQVLALNPASGRAGYSGLARRMADPADSRRVVSVAIGQEQQHEFMHALANLVDEYHDSTAVPIGDFTLKDESRYFTNASSSRDCSRLPWRHLLPGGDVNPGVEGLVGAFGDPRRYHPELKCLMNGTHHNDALYGGDGYLRLRSRLCNLCREIVLFRVYERTGVLPDASRSLEVWKAGYRSAFYRKFPFHAPPALPQRNSEGTPWFSPCAP